ncbi:hypothetical protein KHHGKMAE_0830 [Methylobacterium persicinum]|nr:cbb3-type cytochrome c oxidase subunit 3 [Methylobacterium persicinum]GJE36778.1 hypothetical protein KHHGKMAE_0830 [Methylobacterium persicinum]
MTYESAAAFAQTGGLLYFVVLFAAVVLYAFRPRHRARFDAAAHLPLIED